MAREPESSQSAGREIDSVTGQQTTGHVWDGIRELDRPLPRWWLWTFLACIAWSAVYVVLYPSVPLIKSATGGILGYSSRGEVASTLAEARDAQSGNLDRLAELGLEEIAADPELLRFAVAGGRSAFLVNCVQCHGSGAAGYVGYPNLNDDEWIWGGTLDAIHKTIAYGIRSDHPDTHRSLMPSFGDSLSGNEIAAVTEHVLRLSGHEYDSELADQGGEIFATQCIACHGSEGEGRRVLGGPPLNNAIWLYDDARDTISAQIRNPRHGVMPAWVDRLDPTTVKQLTLYVHTLGGGETGPD